MRDQAKDYIFHARLYHAGLLVAFYCVPGQFFACTEILVGVRLECFLRGRLPVFCVPVRILLVLEQ